MQVSSSIGWFGIQTYGKFFSSYSDRCVQEVHALSRVFVVKFDARVDRVNLLEELS